MRGAPFASRRPARSPASSRLLAAPVMEASGVRKSWETELSSELRSRSASARTSARRASSLACARSMASAIWLAKVSSWWSCSGLSRACASAGLMPSTPTAPRDPTRGRYRARAPGRVAVPSPASCRCSYTQCATASSLVSIENSAGCMRRGATRPSSPGKSTASWPGNTSAICRTAVSSKPSTSRVVARSRLKA